MVNNREPVQLTPSMIPNSPNYDMKDSSFFNKWSDLPLPANVKAQAYAQHLAGYSPDDEIAYSTAYTDLHPLPALFNDMGLFVSVGSMCIFPRPCCSMPLAELSTVCS
jgi:hypothetical protein